jgi:two-component system response regulator HydG
MSKVLLIDDDESMCRLIEDGLSRSGVQVEWRLRGEEAIELLREQDFDVVVTDINLDSMSGLEVCKKITENRPDIPVVVITAFGNMSSAITAIRAGAYDFINKPIELGVLFHTIERAVEHRRLREAVKRLNGEAPAAKRGAGELMGQSRSMLSVYDLIHRVAPTDTTVLLSGESGTGKEVAARALHMASERAQMPFVAINCAAVPPNLLESELFGHVKGAFTDAKDARQGLFQQANGGTLLLDEIGEMPLEMQPKLLRVLQERQVRSVGGNAVSSIDVRIIAATNRELESEVEQGRFREDLYYRLNVVQLQLPPLRERGNDILLLARHFLAKAVARTDKQVTGICTAAARKMLEYDWPGNVRQLENCIERAVALTRFQEITPEDLPDRISRYESPRLGVEDVGTDCITLAELETRYIKTALKSSKGNKTRAAKVLGVDRRTLYRKLERLAQS